MNKADYKMHRKTLALTQRALAARLEVSRETITRRESGALKINKEAKMAMLQLISANIESRNFKATLKT